MRIVQHPILHFETQEKIAFIYEGQTLYGIKGDTVASALHAVGIKALSQSIHLKRPRGFYCAIGNCASCNMVVDGVPNTRTCITPLKEGMVIEHQTNLGVYHDPR